jgi:hypothetical protein
MKLTESEARDILAKAINEAGISADAAQIDKAAAAFVRAENARTFMTRATVAGAIALAVAVAWYVFR